MRVVSGLVIALALTGLAACSSRGDLGRARTDYVSTNVFGAVDRHLITGGKLERSRLPLTDTENRMYDVIWRFFASPTSDDGPLFGLTKVSIIDLNTGKAMEKTDRYYAWLRRTKFNSSRTRYALVNSHVIGDIATIGAAFDGICAVKKLDEQRQVAARSFPELEEEERQDLDLRLAENRYAIRLFALALEYRDESYNYALKRLLVEMPDEKARDVDAGLSSFAISVDAAKRGDYCR